MYFHVLSRNTFPTAVDLVNSAAGYTALILGALAKLDCAEERFRAS